MLVTAHLYNGATVELERAFTKLNHRLREEADLSVEDRMFAAHAICIGNARLGRDLIQGVVEARDSPLARMIRALVLSHYAQYTGDKTALEQALMDIEVALVFAGDTPSFVGSFAHVGHTAVAFGMTDRIDVSPSRIRELWDVVEDVPTGRISMFNLMAVIDTTNALKAVDRWSGPMMDSEILYVVPFLLEHWQPSEVLEFMASEQTLGPYGESWKARTMSFLPERREESAELCRSLLDQHSNYLMRNHTIGTLLLLGRHDEVRQLGPEILRTSDTPFWYSKETLEYLLGHRDETTLVKGAADSRMSRDNAFFAIGMRNLAEGRPDVARESFQECVDLHLFQSEFYWWARAFIAAIELEKPWFRETVSALYEGANS